MKYVAIAIAVLLLVGCSSVKQKEKEVDKLSEARAHFNLGLRMLNNGEFAEALKELQKAEVELKDNPYLINAKGMCFRGLGQVKQAEDQFQRVLRIEPGFFEAQFNLGLLYAAQQDFEKAKKCFIEVRKYKSFNRQDRVHYALGLIFYQEGKKELAATEFKKAFLENPNFLRPYLQLGLLYREMGDNGRALEILERALKIDADVPEILYNIGLVYEGKQDAKNALAYYQSALRSRQCSEELARIVRKRMIQLTGNDDILLEE